MSNRCISFDGCRWGTVGFVAKIAWKWNVQTDYHNKHRVDEQCIHWTALAIFSSPEPWTVTIHLALLVCDPTLPRLCMSAMSLDLQIQPVSLSKTEISVHQIPLDLKLAVVSDSAPYRLNFVTFAPKPLLKRLITNSLECDWVLGLPGYWMRIPAISWVLLEVDGFDLFPAAAECSTDLSNNNNNW